MSENEKGLVVVSGASSGIGLAMTNKLLMEGYSVLGLAKEFGSVEITHEDYWRLVVAFSKPVDHGQRLLKSHTSSESPLAACLNRGSVRHRVRKRHTQFNHVGSRGW